MMAINPSPESPMRAAGDYVTIASNQNYLHKLLVLHLPTLLELVFLLTANIVMPQIVTIVIATPIMTSILLYSLNS